MSFIPHIFCKIIFPRLLKLTVADVFYQAISSRSCFWKQRNSYVNLILFLEAKIFICLSYLVFESKDIHMLILSLPSPVFLPRILLLPQRHCHQHLFTVQHDLSNFSKGSKNLNIKMSVGAPVSVFVTKNDHFLKLCPGGHLGPHVSDEEYVLGMGQLGPPSVTKNVCSGR